MLSVQLTSGPRIHRQCLGFNSLAPGKFEWNLRHVIFKQILVIDGWSISCEITPIWMSLDFTDDQSILVQVMAWCLQATSHYLSQCWPRPLSPLGHNELTHWTLRDVLVILKQYSPNTSYMLSSEALLVKLLSGECHLYVPNADCRLAAWRWHPWLTVIMTPTWWMTTFYGITATSNEHQYILIHLPFHC